MEQSCRFFPTQDWLDCTYTLYDLPIYRGTDGRISIVPLPVQKLADLGKILKRVYCILGPALLWRALRCWRLLGCGGGDFVHCCHRAA